MSHECPECGQLCFCSGDIDDCLLNTDMAIENCTHMQQCDVDYSDEDEIDDWDGTEED